MLPIASCCSQCLLLVVRRSIHTPRHKLPPSPAVSYCLPMSTTDLSDTWLHIGTHRYTSLHIVTHRYTSFTPPTPHPKAYAKEELLPGVTMANRHETFDRKIMSVSTNVGTTFKNTKDQPRYLGGVGEGVWSGWGDCRVNGRVGRRDSSLITNQYPCATRYSTSRLTPQATRHKLHATPH